MFGMGSSVYVLQGTPVNGLNLLRHYNYRAAVSCSTQGEQDQADLISAD